MPLVDGEWTDANFVAGALCLDFSNTLSGRLQDQLRDRLADHADLIAWAEAAGLLQSADGTQAVRDLARMPEKAARCLAEAQSLREAVFVVFEVERLDHQPDTAALDLINDCVTETAALRRLVRTSDGYRWIWDTEADPVRAAFGQIALSAADLLASSRRSLVKKCKGESCAWLFVDDTKNRSRIWCDMAVCGNRAKARRHSASKRRPRT